MPDRKAVRQLRLAYGVTPLLADFTEDKEQMREQSLRLAMESGVVRKDDLAVIITGSLPGFQYADSMQISKI